MSAPGRLRHRIMDRFARRPLWAPGQAVVVAVSGGLDSMVLLDVLLETAAWHRGALRVITVDHGTHPDSAAHAAFVAEVCGAREVEVEVVTLALGAGASEAVCREARYVALLCCPDAVVATAHHRGDQAETVLLQLLRGAPGRGMRRRRGPVVRPLLEEPREALVAWANHRALTWVEDPSNASDRFLRNRVRRELLPLMDQLRPGVEAVLTRGAGRLEEDLDLLDELACGPPTLAWLQQAPWPLARRVLGRSLDIQPRVVESLRGWLQAPRGRVELGGGRWLAVVDGLLEVQT